MDQIIEELLNQRWQNPENDFDKGWNSALDCMIGIFESYIDDRMKAEALGSAHENAHDDLTVPVNIDAVRGS